MPMKRENLTWLPFAFLGMLNMVGLVVFLGAWVAMQAVSPVQTAQHAGSHASKPCLLAIHWGLSKKPISKMQAKHNKEAMKPKKSWRGKSGSIRPHEQHRAQKQQTKQATKKSKFSMDLLSI